MLESEFCFATDEPIMRTSWNALAVVFGFED
jgi:hypothetical protein